MGRLANLRRKKAPPPEPEPDKAVLSECPNCGEDTSVLDSFCPKCGTMLAEEE